MAGDFAESTLPLSLFAVAGIWAATNAVFAAAKIANERRDAVLTGIESGRPLTIAHRKLIMLSDWLPMSVAAGLFCFAYGVSVALIPRLADVQDTYVIWGSRLLALIPLLGGIGFLVGAYFEYRAMQQTLQRARVLEEGALLHR